jgi:hypothetical protein
VSQAMKACMQVAGISARTARKGRGKIRSCNALVRALGGDAPARGQAGPNARGVLFQAQCSSCGSSRSQDQHGPLPRTRQSATTAHPTRKLTRRGESAVPPAWPNRSVVAVGWSVLFAHRLLWTARPCRHLPGWPKPRACPRASVFGPRRPHSANARSTRGIRDACSERATPDRRSVEARLLRQLDCARSGPEPPRPARRRTPPADMMRLKEQGSSPSCSPIASRTRAPQRLADKLRAPQAIVSFIGGSCDDAPLVRMLPRPLPGSRVLQSASTS